MQAYAAPKNLKPRLSLNVGFIQRASYTAKDLNHVPGTGSSLPPPSLTVLGTSGPHPSHHPQLSRPQDKQEKPLPKDKWTPRVLPLQTFQLSCFGSVLSPAVPLPCSEVTHSSWPLILPFFV